MKTKLIVLPNEDGFTALIWGKWVEGSMRVRSFDNRATMIGLLEMLQLLTPQEARELETLEFVDYCPIYSGEIDEETLLAHGFQTAK